MCELTSEKTRLADDFVISFYSFNYIDVAAPVLSSFHPRGVRLANTIICSKTKHQQKEMILFWIKQSFLSLWGTYHSVFHKEPIQFIGKA